MSSEDLLEKCNLCLQPSELKDSHIIPNWIFKDEIRDRNKGGEILQFWNLLRTKKAFILPLLCEACELKFSRWENHAKQASQKSKVGDRYEKWLYWFAVSISWRNLLYQCITAEERNYERQKAILKMPCVAEALECWRLSLVNETPAPGNSRFRQHLFVISPDYELRKSAVLELFDSGEHVFTWTRFGFYGILGLLESRVLGSLKVSEIKVGGGAFPAENTAPASLIRFLHSLEVDVVQRLRDDFR